MGESDSGAVEKLRGQPAFFIVTVTDGRSWKKWDQKKKEHLVNIYFHNNIEMVYI